MSDDISPALNEALVDVLVTEAMANSLRGRLLGEAGRRSVA